MQSASNVHEKNKPSRTIKIWISHDFGQKLQFPLRLFLDKMGLEIMSDDHLVKRRPPRLYKYGFHVVAILNFFKVVI